MGVKVDKRMAVSYCRVSSPWQKDDLLSQQKAVADFCVGAGIAVDEAIVDSGRRIEFKKKAVCQDYVTG